MPASFLSVLLLAVFIKVALHHLILEAHSFSLQWTQVKQRRDAVVLLLIVYGVHVQSSFFRLCVSHARAKCHNILLATSFSRLKASIYTLTEFFWCVS